MIDDLLPPVAVEVTVRYGGRLSSWSACCCYCLVGKKIPSDDERNDTIIGDDKYRWYCICVEVYGRELARGGRAIFAETAKLKYSIAETGIIEIVSLKLDILCN